MKNKTTTRPQEAITALVLTGVFFISLFLIPNHMVAVVSGITLGLILLPLVLRTYCKVHIPNHLLIFSLFFVFLNMMVALKSYVV